MLHITLCFPLDMVYFSELVLPKLTHMNVVLHQRAVVSRLEMQTAQVYICIKPNLAVNLRPFPPVA
jgi:hypothetical protein